MREASPSLPLTAWSQGLSSAGTLQIPVPPGQGGVVLLPLPQEAGSSPRGGLKAIVTSATTVIDSPPAFKKEPLN